MEYYQEEISEKVKNFCEEVPVLKNHENKISAKFIGLKQSRKH